MSNGRVLTPAEQYRQREKAKKAERTARKAWFACHPVWSDFTRNQKRNMRKRLKKR
jgi:hypothetical protein